MNCFGMIDDLRPCRRPASFLVRAQNALTGLHACRYHLIDAVDQTTGAEMSHAIVLRIR